MSVDLASATCTVASPCGYGYKWGEKPSGPLTACGEPVIAVFTFACIHEHIDQALACAGCSAEIQRVADILICPHCDDGPESHECRTVMQIQWLTGEVGGDA